MGARVRVHQGLVPPVKVLVESGAGVGNYYFAAFYGPVARSRGGAISVMSPRGQRRSRVANPTDGGVRP